MGERNKEVENCFIFACVSALPGVSTKRLNGTNKTQAYNIQIGNK